jgi:methionine-rich copper-binding protein CopC
MKILRMLFVTIIILFSSVAWAHTGLRSSVPEDGAIINESPVELSISFRQNVRLVEVTLINAQGDFVAFDFEAPEEEGTTFSWSLPPLSAGYYRVSWVAMGGDAHNVRGEFTFSVK